MADKPKLLTLQEISKAFGGVQALSGISFAVDEGVIMGLIGPNGAGKTTLFNVITGAYTADSGNIFLEGVSIRGKRIQDIVRLGISRTFQNVELFERMSVIENIMVGGHVRTRTGLWGAVTRLPAVRKEETALKARARKLLDFVGLTVAPDQRSGDLPFGWQRLLEIARALASDPKVLLLDEPAAGLNAVETERLGILIRKIRDLGVTVMLVEHDMSLTMNVCDRILVLDQGRMLAEGAPREIQSNAAVMSAYLGTG
ncbi:MULTISPECIES: ABC transporter ATP-binding protein [Desulfococcus]|uniref:ABC transporter related protein n=1 Tax=Desulfococcus multivorans DSM 2059 TaxID=1121405 RepID=S7VK02_DESML|nr:ABC transporter ATP-binding protein [Desulfococcus multivorans]AOY59076.1 LivG3: high-affinity branched-chain amino acid transport ATP-binding protein [Desulfococcus multivorans]AQV01324.1 ABC transporter ATP-binding protein [Desulfococcus multivorans]EPR44888.1 ABC transporter related protein [Desulfococcus multivorans DSM 2059]SJZ82625.1 amino acid/amide ABC transporter ATP-binding protein 1, HAAT family [Desulfococcus multivorans DSM 2059]